jgi:hypothetical protein
MVLRLCHNLTFGPETRYFGRSDGLARRCHGRLLRGIAVSISDITSDAGRFRR